ncbi:MAG: CBS domain-containing protein [Acetobacteraceae bacterium]|nr:CBS domain-containing protein [Acetobacteraceae bacterium]MBV8870911.1 CBS domain-containing protein [Acetobacteraceae bacterium]MBV9118013.1 CBS domain-containing protein [Acetobacteraceae bacterium]
MTRYVEFVAPDATVKEAAELMGELDVGALPAGTEERVEGVVTDRDILYRVVARGLDPSGVRVGDVLSRPVVACGEDDSVSAAMDMMAANHIRRMPVRDARGRVSGWITLADLARKLLVDSETVQGALRAMTEPEG